MCCVVLLFFFFSPSSHLIHPFLRQFAPLIPNFSVVLRQALGHTRQQYNNNEDDGNDDSDRPANGIKGKNTRGIQKALKISLYFAVDSIRSLAHVRVINRRIPSRHFVFFFFRFSHLRCCIFQSVALEIKIPRLQITTNASRRRIAADNIPEKRKTERERERDSDPE